MLDEPKKTTGHPIARQNVELAPPRVAFVTVSAGCAATGCARAGARLVGGMDLDGVALDCFSRNFPGVPASSDLKDIIHPDVVVMANERDTWGRDVVGRLRPRVVCFERKSGDLWLDGYHCYSEVLDALEFGLPQHRKRKFVVAFRLDARPKFIAFPFPDAPGRAGRAQDILEEGRNDLLVSEEWKTRMARRDKEKREAGFRFALRRVGADDVFPSLSRWHAGLKTSMVVAAPEGDRLLSEREARRLMGAPDDLVLPAARSKAFLLLAEDLCAPIAAAIMEEIKVWLY